MSNWVGALYVSLIGCLSYTAIVAVAALAAVFAPTPARRRSAREVLRILIRRDKKDI